MRASSSARDHTLAVGRQRPTHRVHPPRRKGEHYTIGENLYWRKRPARSATTPHHHRDDTWSYDETTMLKMAEFASPSPHRPQHLAPRRLTADGGITRRTRRGDAQEDRAPAHRVCSHKLGHAVIFAVANRRRVARHDVQSLVSPRRERLASAARRSRPQRVSPTPSASTPTPRVLPPRRPDPPHEGRRRHPAGGGIEGSSCCPHHRLAGPRSPPVAHRREHVLARALRRGRDYDVLLIDCHRPRCSPSTPHGRGLRADPLQCEASATRRWPVARDHRGRAHFANETSRSSRHRHMYDGRTRHAAWCARGVQRYGLRLLEPPFPSRCALPRPRARALDPPARPGSPGAAAYRALAAQLLASRLRRPRRDAPWCTGCRWCVSPAGERRSDGGRVHPANARP